MIIEAQVSPEFPRKHLTIQGQTLTRTEKPFRHAESGGNPYAMEASLLVPPHAQATVFWIHGASPPKTQPPVEKYTHFQESMAKQNAATFVFDSRSVGIEKNNYDFATKQFKSSRDDIYKGTSLNDRIDDAANGLLWLVMQPSIPQRIILGGVSMGGHIAVRLVDRLQEMQQTDPSLENRALAATALERVKGFLLVAPAAYMEDVEDAPSRSPEGTPQEETRTYKLQHASPEDVVKQSPVFATLDKTTNLPLFIAHGQKDTVIPQEILAAYYKQALMHDRTRSFRFVDIAPSFPHAGLVYSVTPEDFQENYDMARNEQEVMFKKMGNFVKEVASLP